LVPASATLRCNETKTTCLNKNDEAPMPAVDAAVDLGRLSKAEVWPTLISFERYPEWMEDVILVEVLSRGSDFMVTSWEVLLNGSRFTWTERDILKEPSLIEFEQIDGDLEVWRGRWELINRGENLWAELRVEFDIGIPSLAEILDPIGKRAIRANSQQMLDAVRDQSHLVRA
jgi:hypothetical protein